MSKKKGQTLPPENTALVVIDVQRRFCDPKVHPKNSHVKDTPRRIQSAVPAFRKAGIKTVAVYYADRQGCFDPSEYYAFRPSRDDRIVVKTTDSAFASGSLEAHLRQEKTKTLIVCGFNLAACVQDTVLDALDRGYKVILLRDLTGHNRPSLYPGDMEDRIKNLRKKGAVILKSTQVLAMAGA